MTDGTASQPLTRIDCDKANMVWTESANVCGEKSEGTEAGAAPKIEAGPQTLSTAASNQPLTRSDCDKVGMAWNDSANVCGSVAGEATAQAAPYSEAPETVSQPLTRADCNKARMQWGDSERMRDQIGTIENSGCIRGSARSVDRRHRQSATDTN